MRAFAGSLLLNLLSAVMAFALQCGEAIRLDADGRLVYEISPSGDRVPDFSSAGFGGGGVVLPRAEVRVVVDIPAGDAAESIQAALDEVAALEPDADGMRGAVQLLAGSYRLERSLYIRESGVVLRGVGAFEGGTVLEAVMQTRDPIIQVGGNEDASVLGEALAVVSETVPVGDLKVPVSDASRFKPGDHVRIRRPSTEDWIESLGMDRSPARTHYAWKPGHLDLVWEREIEAVEDGVLFLSAPLTTALDARHGGAIVERIVKSDRLAKTGIEQLRLVCPFSSQNPKSEEHPWMGIQLNAVEDAWVRDVSAEGLASAVVYLGSMTRAVTVMDVQSLRPQSEIGGYRRFGFFSAGQQNLFVRCEAEDALHAFAVGALAAGPTVFHDCRATQLGGFSGSIGSWASGILFDGVEVEGGALTLDNLEIEFGGAGWAAANSVLWQCSASKIVCRSPPGAQNWAIGVWGQFWGDGRWQASNEFVEPRSLYLAQLQERLGAGALQALASFHIEPEEAGILGRLPHRVVADVSSAPVEGMRLVNGWLIDADGIMAGGTRPVAWWRGHLLPSRAAEHGAALTRWLPGRTGPGETDDLAELAREMAVRGERVLRHHWGLWYDRRREDHQMVSRMSPLVWPPFFEQPWARSGQGTAWDGLSLYDLTRFNPWYFGRLKTFAQKAAEHGRVLVNEMYFQHNILESGAHWVDFPWRPVNCLQETVFPEPPPFEGDTIRMAHAFYDLTVPLHKSLHEAYIRHCLNNLKGEPNVIHTLGDEYSGPLPFMQFWLDVIGKWSQEDTNREILVALSAPKDVQDAVLADAVRSSLVDIIELKYWWRSGSEIFAPAGGIELAPRQHARKWKGGRPSAEDLARMVREYRSRFPDKAVIYSELPIDHPWAAFAAGASLPPLPLTTDAAILSPGAAYALSPSQAGQWGIRVDGQCELIYVRSGQSLVVDLEGWSTGALVRLVEQKTGQPVGPGLPLAAEKRHVVQPFVETAGVYWITKEAE